MKRIIVEKLAFTEDEKEILEKACDILQEIDNETDGIGGCSICPLASDCPDDCAILKCYDNLKRIIDNA